MSEPGLFETMYQCRALRYFKDEPVPDDVIRKVLDAAIQAPSGSNRQSWHFVVVTDPEIKKTIQGYYKQSFDVYASMMAHVPPRSGVTEETQARVVKSAVYLSEHLHEAPVLIIPCLRFEQGRIAGDGAMQDMARKSLYSSIYPAVQNLLLACRGVGLAACLTTLHLMYEEPIAKLLGLPDNAETMALIPIGWPNAKFGPVKRVPVEEVASRNRFGQKL
ncbi:MAG: nitroreductase family protein [Candidatus Binatia bacterium]